LEQHGLEVELDAIVIFTNFGKLMRIIANMRRGVGN